MKLPKTIPIYGDTSYRGPCPHESVEQITFFNFLRYQYPKTYGLIAIHPRNEGERHHAQTIRHKAEGLTTGAADIIIAGNPTFVMEMKRKDHTKSSWQPGQIEYLEACKNAGAFVGVALGHKAAYDAFEDWRKIFS